MAPDVAHDFLRKTNITDHIDFDFVDDNDHEFEIVDPDRDLSDPNDMDFEHDPMDDFMPYGINPDEHHHQQQHHMHMEDGSESPDLLLQFSTSMLEDSDEHEKSRDSAYGHHDLMSMHTVDVGSIQHPHDMSQTLPQTMMDMSHNQLYNMNYHHG
jgi:hypothetical protein